MKLTRSDEWTLHHILLKLYSGEILTLDERFAFSRIETIIRHTDITKLTVDNCCFYAEAIGKFELITQFMGIRHSKKEEK